MLANCLAELSGKEVGAAVKKPKCFRLKIAELLAELGNDPEVNSIGNISRGDTVGYMSDLGNFPEV